MSAGPRGPRGVLAVAAGACLLLALFAPAVFLGETFVARDLSSLHRPTKVLLVRLVKTSEGLPTWNPYIASGELFAASPIHNLFHPLTALFLFLPFEWAFRLQVILPVAFSMWAMWFLLRTLRRGAWAALFGAVAWALGGGLLSSTEFLTTLVTLAPLPAVLAFAVRVIRDGKAGSWVSLALVFGIQALGAEPAVLAMTLILLVTAAAPELTRALRRDGARRCAIRGGWCAVALTLGLGLAGAALVPAAALAAKSVRAAGLPDDVASVWSFPLGRLLELLFPRLLWDVGNAAGYWGGGLYPRQGFPYFPSIYPGLLATVLALVAFVHARRLRLWALTAGFGVLLGAGFNLPVYPALRRLVPGLDGIRYPERFLLLLVVPLVIAASAGLDLLRLRGVRRQALAGLAAAGALGIAASASPGLLLRALGAVPAHLSLAPGVEALARRGFLLSGAAAAAYLAIVLGTAGRGLRLARWCGAAATAVAALELLPLGWGVVRTAPVDTVARPPAFLASALDPPLSGPLFNYAASVAPLLHLPLETLAAPPKPAQWGIATTFEIDYSMSVLAWSETATRLFWELAQENGRLMGPLLSRRGVAAVVVPRRGGPASSPDVEVVRTRGARPFAFLAERMEAVDGPEGWKEAMRRLGPLAASTVCLDRADGEPPVAKTPSGGTVSDLVREANAVRMTVDVSGPDAGLLALNQTWEAGWKVRVDGAPARLLRADISLQALALPPGRHRVTLRHRDASVTRGLAVSAASAVALLLVVALARRREEN